MALTLCFKLTVFFTLFKSIHFNCRETHTNLLTCYVLRYILSQFCLTTFQGTVRTYVK